MPIAEPVEGVERALAPMFAGRARDITEENIQSRARGLILMSISNKFGAMVVTTGNKSEMSVGYATLYGDMNGGFNPIKDLYKMEVFRLRALRNRWKPVGAKGPDGEVIPPPSSPSRRRRNCARTRRTRIRCRPIAMLDAILQRPGRKGNARRRHRRRRLRPRHRAAGRAAALSRRIQAPAIGAGRQGRPEEFDESFEWPRCSITSPTRLLPANYRREEHHAGSGREREEFVELMLLVVVDDGHARTGMRFADVGVEEGGNKKFILGGGGNDGARAGSLQSALFDGDGRDRPSMKSTSGLLHLIQELAQAVEKELSMYLRWPSA